MPPGTISTGDFHGAVIDRQHPAAEQVVGVVFRLLFGFEDEGVGMPNILIDGLYLGFKRH
jgi:hypothetical protein